MTQCKGSSLHAAPGHTRRALSWYSTPGRCSSFSSVLNLKPGVLLGADQNSRTGNIPHIMTMTWVLIVTGILVFLAIALTPQKCVVDGPELRVRTRLFTFHFDLREAVEVRPVPQGEVRASFRLFGVGWPMQRYGWFRSPELGTFLNLANDPSHMYLIRFPKWKLIASPPNRLEDLAAYVQAQ